VVARQVGGFVRCGRLAGTLAPVMLFFVAAAGATRELYLLAIVGIGLVGVIDGALQIGAAEAGSPRAAAAGALGLLWMALALDLGASLLYTLA
jgi:hypothetical protein